MNGKPALHKIERPASFQVTEDNPRDNRYTICVRQTVPDHAESEFYEARGVRKFSPLDIAGAALLATGARAAVVAVTTIKRGIPVELDRYTVWQAADGRIVSRWV